jgi:FkbM family methyltransferase
LFGKASRCQIENLPDLLLQFVGFKAGGCFVDVGAFDGETFSNTAPLADIGWRGVMFEPNPAMAEKCRLRHASNRVTVVEAAVGKATAMVELHLGGTISTTKAEYVEHYKDIEEFSFVAWDPPIPVLQVRLDDELERLGFPSPIDFVSVDVEGAEFEVLAGFSMEHWKPRLIVWETRAKFHDERLSWMGPAMNKAMLERGYRLVQEDTINSVYVPV